MKSGKSILFPVLTAAFVVLLLAAGALLGRAILRLNSTKNDIRTCMTTLDGLYANNPFPSPGNVEREKENGHKLLGWFKELTKLARGEQEPPVERTPSNFMSLLGDRRAQLSQMANKNGVELAPSFAFGFDRYFAAGSTLPAKEDVPRLTEQLMIIDKLSAALFDEHVSALLSIEREEFEASSAGATAKRRGARRPAMTGPAVANTGLIGKDDLFGKMHFVIEMRAREKSLMSVLNRLAREDLFVTVTGVGVEKERSDILPVEEDETTKEVDAAAEGGVAQTNQIPSRSQRIISGTEVEQPMKVILDLDVYKFPLE